MNGRTGGWICTSHVVEFYPLDPRMPALPPPLPEPLRPWVPAIAKTRFLTRFHQLKERLQ